MWDRQCPASLGEIKEGGNTSSSGLSDIWRELNDPAYVKCRLSVSGLVNYMVYRQREKYDTDIRFDGRALHRNMKLLVDKYGADEVQQAIHQTLIDSPWPFSTKALRVRLECKDG